MEAPPGWQRWWRVATQVLRPMWGTYTLASQLVLAPLVGLALAGKVQISHRRSSADVRCEAGLMHGGCGRCCN